MQILSFVISVFLLGILIALHELGHYLAAKAFGVYIFEYSLGFGPKLYQKKGRETKFTVRAIPIGGYVAMFGEDDAIPEDAPHDLDIQRSLMKKKKWQRAIVMSAGIIINLVIAYPIFVISNALPTTELDPNQTIQVEANSVAASVGFLAGDHIVAMRDIEDKPVTIGVDDGDQAAVFDQIAITVDTSEFNYHVVFFNARQKIPRLKTFLP